MISDKNSIVFTEAEKAQRKFKPVIQILIFFLVYLIFYLVANVIVTVAMGIAVFSSNDIKDSFTESSGQQDCRTCISQARQSSHKQEL